MSFITVKYGANEERLANPNVLSSVLLNHLKTACGFGDMPENVDLASETGEVIDLINKQKDYAKRYVDARGSYILVKVLGDDGDDSTATYSSLLDQVGTEKLKFSVVRAKNKGKGGRADGTSRRGGNNDDDTPASNASVAGSSGLSTSNSKDGAGGGGASNRRGGGGAGAAGAGGAGGTGGSKGSKNAGSALSSTTSLYEAPNTSGAGGTGASRRPVKEKSLTNAATASLGGGAGGAKGKKK